jgi:hypothetical protein
MAVMVGATVMRDASGDISDLMNVLNASSTLSLNDSIMPTLSENQTRNWSPYGTDFNCTTKRCDYGSQNSFQVLNILL